MKNIKKIVAVLLSMTAIASTTAMAAASEATYEDGTASLALAENEITAAANDQLTVVIVPKDAESITSDNIYYINQGAFEEEFTNILKAMKVKDGFGDAKDYEVRIGGVKKDGEYAVAKFYFKADEPTILYGDADGNGKILTTDAILVLQHVADSSIAVKAGADADGSGKILTTDAILILQKVADNSIVLGPKK